MTAIFVAVAVVVVGSFAAGTFANIRRGNQILRWMQGGLPLLGARTTVRWIGSTAVELVLRAAHAPFEQVTVVVFLEPRDMPWMWALSRWRGRRDTIILRGQLRAPPEEELELLDRESWSGREALPRIDVRAWSTREPSSPGGLALYHDGPGARDRADALDVIVRRAGLVVRRLSVRRALPHFQFHVAPPSAAMPASEFFDAVRALGETAGSAGRRIPSLSS